MNATFYEPDAERLLDDMLAEYSLPPEAREHVRGTFEFACRLMTRRMRAAINDAVALRHKGRLN